jgi:L-amino acid N-acyltransferase YncA
MQQRKGVHVAPWRILAAWLSPFGELSVARLYEKDLASPLAAFAAKVSVTVGQATGLDIERIAELGATLDGSLSESALRGQFSDRIRRGARCFVAKIDDQVVHYNWLIFDRMESWPSTQVLREREAYCTDAYTVHAWRGRAIHTEVLYRMLLFLQEAGYRRAYTIVAAQNEASWKTHHRLQWQLSGIAFCFKPRYRSKMLVWTMAWGPRERNRALVRESAGVSAN